MRFVKRRPSAAISRFVDYLWLLSDAPSHAKERILPTGTLELVVNLHDDQIGIYDDAGVRQRFSGTVISGAYDRPFEIDAAAHALIMGVHFRPGGASPFIRLAPGELANAHVDAAALWGTFPAARLRERLCGAVSHQDRFDILDRTLVAQAGRAGLTTSPVLARALPRLLHPEENVSQIVASLGVSHRHFAELFRREVGMAPKTFARIQRFQRVIAVVRERPAGNAARLALDCGYYDQAHMNRDFAAFARVTPREYLRQHGGRTKDHHVVLG